MGSKVVTVPYINSSHWRVICACVVNLDIRTTCSCPFMLRLFVKVLGPIGTSTDDSTSFTQRLNARLTELTDGATVGGIFIDEFDVIFEESLKDLVESIDGIVSGPDKDGSKYSRLFWVALRYHVSENCITGTFWSKEQVAGRCFYS